MDEQRKAVTSGELAAMIEDSTARILSILQKYDLRFGIIGKWMKKTDERMERLTDTIVGAHERRLERLENRLAGNRGKPSR